MNPGQMAQEADVVAIERTQRLAPDAALGWLRAGWRDLVTQPALSLLYGVAVFLASLAALALIILGGWGNVLFPAVAAFLIVGPVAAVGLYEKSRRLEANESIALRDILFVGFRPGQQIFFVGAILALLAVLWMRAAKITYALFFGWRPVPDSFWEVLEVLFLTPMGLAMLVAGSAIGALFAAFAFAISAFSIPMLLDRDIDAFTAMGTSMRLALRNVLPMTVWGAIVLAAFLISLATGLVGLVIAFPLIGHATWHGYRAVRDSAGDLAREQGTV